MKIKFLIALLFVLCLGYNASAQLYGGGNSQPTSSIGANAAGTIKLGAGLAYGAKAGITDDGEETGGLGLSIGGEYFFTPNISVAPSFTYFFKSEMSENFGGVTYTASGQLSYLDIDGRYYIGLGNLNLYGLLGLSTAIGTVSFQDESETESESGINIGAGVAFPLANGLELTGQLKYASPYDGQMILNAGVSFKLR